MQGCRKGEQLPKKTYYCGRWRERKKQKKKKSFMAGSDHRRLARTIAILLTRQSTYLPYLHTTKTPAYGHWMPYICIVVLVDPILIYSLHILHFISLYWAVTLHELFIHSTCTTLVRSCGILTGPTLSVASGDSRNRSRQASSFLAPYIYGPQFPACL